jgi:hypothetical protein
MVPHTETTLLNNDERTYIKSFNSIQNREKAEVDECFKMANLLSPKEIAPKTLSIFLTKFTQQVNYLISSNTSSLSLLIQQEFIDVVKAIFEIIPSDETQSLILYKLLIQVQAVLTYLRGELRSKTFNFTNSRQFLTLIIERIKDQNLPFHYIFEQLTSSQVKNPITVSYG